MCSWHFCGQNTQIKFMRKTERNGLKWSQNAPFAFFFSKISRGSPPNPHVHTDKPTAVPPIILSTNSFHPAVDLASGSIIDNVHFGAILLKDTCSLSKLKRLDLHSRLHHFASFFPNFLGGGPPNPHLQEGRPLPYPPPLGPSGLENPPPRLASGSATG